MIIINAMLVVRIVHIVLTQQPVAHVTMVIIKKTTIVCKITAKLTNTGTMTMMVVQIA